MNSVSATSSRFPSFQQWSPIGVIAGGIFVIDLLIPLGVATGVLYLTAVLMSLRHRNSHLPLWTALVCSSLTIIALFLSPVGGELWKVLVNRALSLFAIWTTTLMGHYQLQQAEIIQAREKTIQDFIDTMPSACFSFDQQGMILSWNLAAERMYGYSKQEVIGVSCFDLMVTPETYEDSKNVIAGLFQGKSFQDMIWHDKDKNGEYGWRAGNLFPVFDSQGNVAYGVNFNIDITLQKRAEFELQTNNALLTAILESATDAIYAKNHEGKYLLLNQAAAEIIGKPSEAIIGLDDTQLLGPKTGEFLSQFDQKLYAGNQSLSFEGTISISENTRTFSTTKSPLKDHSGKIIGLVGISRDITEQKHIQQDLLLTDRVFMATPDHISILGSDYRYRRVNPSYNEAFGKTGQELVGKSVSDLLGKETFDQLVKSKLERCFQGEEIYYEAWFTFPENQSRYMTASYLPLNRNNQGIEEIVVISRDLTERKHIETSLQQSEARLQAILDNSPGLIFLKDLNGRYLHVNQQFKKVFHLEEEEIIGRTDEEVFSADQASLFSTHDRCVSELQEPLEFEEEATYVDGCHTSIVNKFPLFNEKGQMFAIGGITTDITERKRAEELLMKWATIFQHTQWGVAVSKGESSIFEMVNEAYARMHGYPIREIEGMSVSQVFAPEFRSQLPNIIQQIHDEGFLSFEALHIRKDGSTFPALVSVSAIKDLNGQTLYRVANVIDISDHKKAEEAFRQSERLAYSAMNALTAQLCVLDETGQILTTNERWDQFARKNDGDPKKLGKGINYITICIQSAQNGEKDAKTFLEGLKAVLTKQQEEFSFDYPCSSPEKIRWFSARVTRFPDPGPIRAVVSHYDITERKILEAAIRKQTVNLETEVIRRTNRIQELEQRRMQVEKLAALAQIAAGVAHEINNPLASISQSLVLLKRAIPQEHPHLRYMAKVEDCIDRIAQITKHLYQLYRPSGPIPTPIDLRVPLHTAKDIMVERAQKYGIRIRTSPIPDSITASVPQGELTQVLCNLIQNAIEASPTESTIDVSIVTGPETLSILVADQGQGIPPEAASHIFEPFYTTKQNHAEGGMGLGLSISHSLIESMGGKLDFSTSIGQGSTFTIKLPLT